MNPEETGRELIQIIKTKFITADGLLARHYPPRERTLFDNFDDLVPFFLYFGEHDFLLSQVRKIKKAGLDFVKVCADRGVFSTREIDEWFGGLYALWKETNDKEAEALLRDSVDFLKAHIIKNDNLSAAYYVQPGKSLKCYEPWSAGLLETFCEMKDDFPELAELAQKTMSSWTKEEYFQKYGLFPYRIFSSFPAAMIQKHLLSSRIPYPLNSKAPFWEDKGLLRFLKNKNRLMRFYFINGQYSQMMKSNSTPAFTLIELYKMTGEAYWADALTKWIQGALVRFCKDGRVFREYLPKARKRRTVSIVPAFIFTDVLCDAAHFMPKSREYLTKAKEIIDYNWSTRLENGLIPENIGCTYAHLDNQIDFSISMRRYAELSEEGKYLDRSKELCENALEIHYAPEGFVTYSGRGKEKVIDPKYNALVLKGLIHLMTIKEPLYAGHYALFKDR